MNKRHQLKLSGETFEVQVDYDIDSDPRYAYRAQVTHLQGFHPVTYAPTEPQAIRKMTVLLGEYQALTYEQS